MRFASFATAIAILASANGFGQQVGRGPILSQQQRQKLFGSIPKTLSGIVPGKVMVRFSPGQAAAMASHPAPLAGAPVPMMFVSQIASTGWTMWTIPVKVDPTSLAKTLKANMPGVQFAEPLFKIFPLQVNLPTLNPPNDPDFSYVETDPNLILDFSGDGSAPTSFDRMWNLEDIFALDGWAIYPGKYFTATSRPNYTPKLAIIDTGCDIDHPDFINAGGTGTDVSQGGQLILSKSTFFTNGVPSGSETVADADGHGTHVSGIAVAAANNGPFSSSVDNGIPGVGYNANAMILRVFDNSGNGTDADAAAAMYYAADNGADIMSLSLGDTTYSQLFQDATTYAFQKGVCVFAAGYESGQYPGANTPIYPAACSGAFGVTAAAPGYGPATDNYAGVGYDIQVAAPGGDVLTDQVNYEMIQYVWSTEMETPGALYNNQSLYPPYTTNYGYLTGTSMACPHVSGAAALYYGQHSLSQKSGAANIAAYRAISSSATDVFGVSGGGWEPTFGYGELNVEALLAGINTRSATVGSIDGILYYNETVVAHVGITAVVNGLTFSTSTEEDGTYRFDQMPAGTVKLSAAPYGALKTKYTVVRPGSDTPGVDFWCGTYTTDTTPPVFQWLLPATVAHAPGYFHFFLWAYDTESGVDKITFQVGSTSGASDVIKTTQLVNDQCSNDYPASFTPGKTYYLTSTATNGAGLSTTKTVSFVWHGP